MGKGNTIYPRYMDSEASLADGRRLGREHSVPRPTIEEIAAAIRKTYPSAQMHVDSNKRYPKGAVEANDIGYLKLDKDTIKAAGGKRNLMIALQSHILDARQATIDALKQTEEPAQEPKEGKD